MIRTFFFFLILSALVVFAAWLSEHPGTVLVTFDEYRLRTSVGFLVVAAALLALALTFLDRIWRYLVAAPHRIALAFQENRRRRGYRALTQGMVAVAAGDSEEAGRQAKRAEGLLHDPPLTMLLSAQAAQLRGDESAAANYFESMLHHPEMAFLGIRGLFMQALREGDNENALRLAQRAYELHPKTPWVVQALFDLQVRAGRWDEAEATLKHATTRKAIPSAEGKRQTAVLLLRQSEIAEGQGRDQEARQLAQQALKLAPGFVPVSARYARLAAKAGETHRAARAIEKAWAKAPHPDLAAIYLEITSTEDALGHLKRIEKLAAFHPNHPESHLAIAEVAIEARIWGDARDHLAAAIAAMPSARAFRRMAELEEAEAGKGRVAEQWRTRAAEAPADNRWVCGHCSAIADSWSRICGNCGGFDGLEWRSPRSGSVERTAAFPRHRTGRSAWFSRENMAVPNR
ncbi:MAG: tetratricopeptide repeat protein [Alphaproteobacteria bacterium]|nr:tetratricopeptide repeat protein [Alphaproteobacteria bacterium]